jgi:hypothetical protein
MRGSEDGAPEVAYDSGKALIEVLQRVTVTLPCTQDERNWSGCEHLVH